MTNQVPNPMQMPEIHDAPSELARLALELPGSGSFDWNLLTEDLTFAGAIANDMGLPTKTKRRLLDGLFPQSLEPHSDWLVLLLARIPSFNGIAAFDRYLKCKQVDGHFVWLRIRGQIVFTDDTVRRRPIHLRGVVDDVTDLYSKIDQYHVIFESIGEGVVSFNSDWAYVYVNKNAEKLLGRSAEQLIGKVFWDVFPEVLGSPLEKVFRAAMAGEHTFYEHFYEPWNRWFGNYCSKSATGGVTVVFQDITDKKHAEQARQAAEHKALVDQTSVAAQTVAALAHELNQPLMVLEANSSSLARLLNDKEINRDVRAIILENEKQTKRAGDIFKDLVVKISGWRNTQKVEAHYDVHALIEACTRATMARFPDTHIHLDLSATQHHAAGDQIKIEKALLNVLANAAESLGPHAIKPPKIYVMSASKLSKLFIHVCDTGAGLSEEAKAALFTEFASTKKNGLGLGLSIAKSLFEDQGGKIWFHGNLSPGAEFRMELPLADEH
ncbi:two-component system sensor histidine kinase NtrB [Rhodoferax mekongensis]|uniref:histidine kinase n=1 Tax=Rhodoferax mekongensis TaxID=3068341 RepID=A0ABZ0B351_9BURK|nr:PAS domain-containing sensor histidine kinase [Rhodoferax sp. TBRC 17307]WNO06145.1 PAS domain-containing sensor histidine kinase [Rhodoferax sp. TBRC 17307]